MVLVGWMALASAAVVALTTPPAAAFVVLAVGLVGVLTLFLSLRWGGGAAAVALVVFVVASGTGPSAPWALTGEDVQRLLRSLVRWQTLAPDLLAGVALAGTAVCAELASAGLEWDLVLRGAAGRRRRTEEVGPWLQRQEETSQ
jgi:TRAP-type C4-dicarboxylate transport system permease large subunit